MIKNPAASAKDMGSISGSGTSPREGNGNPLQYSCLEGPINRGAWWAKVYGVAKELNTTENCAHTNTYFYSAELIRNVGLWKQRGRK